MLWSVVNLNDFFLHQAECHLDKEDLLVLFEETTRNPLINGHSDLLSEGNYTLLFFFKLFCFIHSFEEESCERLKRVLVHIVDNAELDQ